MEVILRLNEVKDITGLSRSSIDAAMNAGEFPERIALGVHKGALWYRIHGDTAALATNFTPSSTKSVSLVS